MRGGPTTTGHILIPNTVLVQYVKTLDVSLGREVDVPIESSGGDPEHLLSCDPFKMFVRDLVVEDAHFVVGYGSW